ELLALEPLLPLAQEAQLAVELRARTLRGVRVVDERHDEVSRGVIAEHVQHARDVEGGGRVGVELEDRLEDARQARIRAATFERAHERDQARIRQQRADDAAPGLRQRRVEDRRDRIGSLFLRRLVARAALEAPARLGLLAQARGRQVQARRELLEQRLA